MPLDSRILNGRVVTPHGITLTDLTIDGGRIVDAPDDAEIWREIDANGYFVLPGLIQPAHEGALALAQVRAGVTTTSVTALLDSTVPEGHALAPEVVDRFAREMTLDWVPGCELRAGARPNDISLARQAGVAVFDVTARPPAPSITEALMGSRVRLRADSQYATAWAAAAGPLRVCLTSIQASDLARFRAARHARPPGSIMLEVSTADLRDSPSLWDALLGGEFDLVTGDDELAALPFLYGEGVERRGLPLPRLAQLLAENPARFYGLTPAKGSLAPGSDGDVFVFDPGPVDERAGACLRGRVVFALLRGDILLFNDELHVFPGHGRMLTPRAAGWGNE